MAIVRFVTDSTADLPPGLAQEHKIAVLPVRVHFENKIYRDGVDLTATDFYNRLRTVGRPPKTTPPPAAEFGETFYVLSKEADLVVALLLSRKLGATFDNATAGRVVAQMAHNLHSPLLSSANTRIEIIDSEMTSIGLGMIIFAAVKEATEEVDPAQFLARIEQIKRQTNLIFTVDTLDYLVRSGRLGAARGAIGNALDVKPILAIRKGEVVVLDQVRGRERSIERMVELMVQNLGMRKPSLIAIAHGDDAVGASALRKRIEGVLNVKVAYEAAPGAGLGTNTGPGSLAIAYQTED